MKVADVYRALDGFCPFADAEPWDSVGILVGDAQADVACALVCLDVTPAAIEAAKAAGATLIVSHHPVIFQPLAALTADSMPYALAQAGIAAIAAHTNLDKAAGGVGDALVKALDLTPVNSTDPLVRIATTAKPTDPQAFAAEVGRRLGTAVRVHTGNSPIKTVAVACGAGGDCIDRLAAWQADALVTGEVKHHEWLLASDRTVIDAGHAATERVIVAPLTERLRTMLPTIRWVAFEAALPYETV